MDNRHTVCPDADVLVVGDRIEAIGVALPVPEGAARVDASGGIVMPGIVDTHRHMWQTAMRGYGADWTLTQYFVWYYLEHGKSFRPEDIYAGNLLSAIESLDAGVTTTVDWSHGLRPRSTQTRPSTPSRRCRVASCGLRQHRGRPVGVVGIAGVPRLRRPRMHRSDMLGFQMAFDVTGDPSFPEKAAFEVAASWASRHHARRVWGNERQRHPADARQRFMTPESVYVHAATLSADSYHRIAATGGSDSVATESEQSCGQGYPPTWVLRRHDIPVSLSMDTSVWQSGDLFSAMRATLGADRARVHFEAHANGETVTHSRCAPSGWWSGPPAAAPRRWAWTTRWAASRSARRPTSS